MNWQAILDKVLTPKLIATVVITAVLLLARYWIARYIRSANLSWTSQQRLKWIGITRSVIFIVLVLAMVVLWGAVIQGLAVSVFAIAFAMVFSVKEICMSLNGYIVRMRGQFFDIGDRIEIKDVRGDVIQSTFLSTTILEVGKGAATHQYTGRRICFSNQMFLTEVLKNESFLEKFYMHNIVIPLKMHEDWKRAKQVLLQIAQEECEPYLQEAHTRLRQMERSRSLELPTVEPRVTLSIIDTDLLHLNLRIPSPAHLKGKLEQVVITRFLDEFKKD